MNAHPHSYRLPAILGPNRPADRYLAVASSATQPQAERGDDLIGLLRLAVDQVPHGMLILDETSTLIAVNQPASAIFGYTSSDLIGQPIERIVPESASRVLHADLWARDTMPHPTRMTPLRQTAVGVRKDGAKVPVEFALNVVSKGDCRYLVVSLTDVTERLNLEDRLVAATHERLGFQRLVSDIAGQFASVESGALDELILNTLRQIVEALQLDRAILWPWNMDDGTAVPMHYSIHPPDQSPPVALPVASSPFMMSRLRAGEVVWFTTVDDLPDPLDRETFRRLGLRSAIALPLTPQKATGAPWVLTFSSATIEQQWIPAVVERLRLVAGVISQALARRSSQVALQTALDELHELRARPSVSIPERRRNVKLAGAACRIVSESAAVSHALAEIEQVAGTTATVLLRGETGAGKEVFAQAIHDLSPRHRRPMVVVSCAAIPTALIESELFGRERGAYTGALSRQIGRFEAANQSTLFLDEIGDLPTEMQVKLLRVLQERVIERLGSTQPIKVDVRIIAATHRDLEKAVREGTFREDLFYRLNVFPVVVPPLRERVEDIPGLVWAFVDEFSRAYGKTTTSISHASMLDLQRYPWPGNVRELRNVIERAVIISTNDQLVVPAPRASGTLLPQTAMTLATLEVEHIRSILDSTNWRVRGRGGAAERLGLKPTTLESRMARLGIVRKKIS